MFAMTETAAEAITALTENQGEGEGGLRIAATEAPEGELKLALAVSGAPESGDEVLGTDLGAKVFMEPRAAQFLDDKVLDV